MQYIYIFKYPEESILRICVRPKLNKSCYDQGESDLMNHEMLILLNESDPSTSKIRSVTESFDNGNCNCCVLSNCACEVPFALCSTGKAQFISPPQWSDCDSLSSLSHVSKPAFVL